MKLNLLIQPTLYTSHRVLSIFSQKIITERVMIETYSEIDKLTKTAENKRESMLLPQHIREILAKSKCLYSKIEVEQALDKMALEISYRLAEKNPIFLCVVVGGIIPLGDRK